TRRSSDLVRGGIQVLELLTRELLVARQIEVRAVVNALELLPAERKFVLDVVRVLGVMGELFLGMLVKAQLLRPDAQTPQPLHPLLTPELEPLEVRARLDEELHLHLLELARAEDEVPGRDLVTERLPDLRDAEGDLLPRRLQHVQVVHVDPLRRLGTQIDDRGRVLHRAHERLEHEVEHARRRQRALAAAYGTLRRRLARRALDPRIVGAKPVLAMLAVHEGIGEAGHVSRRLPYLGMHQDRGVEPLDVLTLVHHGAPPALLDVLLELDAQRPVVPHGAEATVDLGRLKHEAAPLGERHQLLHDVVGRGHRGPEDRRAARRQATRTPGAPRARRGPRYPWRRAVCPRRRARGARSVLRPGPRSPRLSSWQPARAAPPRPR